MQQDGAKTATFRFKIRPNTKQDGVCRVAMNLKLICKTYENVKSSPSALEDTRSGALEPRFGRVKENDNLRVQVLHLVEDFENFD
ncbi:hypothetical protein TNCV_757311 [Trichonephila clavipes]|nr:hypothetical protein TNCV_757311 [Trichonephila clavipes]